ncbi:DegT/DnrJ/EryC1/StrS family aminotransferase [Flavobacterium sp. LHD-80]|uniref:DegT/DnrJ/EryC1/StrS family aminotransferase n=1 Tax=Flavobacterium sp. LHD-80 TaxID=3071411 RepID=UPI0027DFC7BF|nr:DegT/DnrJ/EryC1/StrS family aminotransferase [Flavobacterium sp. LHD-80]MDQ6472063.1 DegT/DnrJ/EryC1/StrS family aminotransferase [Flavobacterium sp. LHD-80]
MSTITKIPFSKIFIGDSERKYLNEVLDSGWLTTAGKTLEFEKKFADFIGAKYACAVNSCTAALHLGIDALGIKAGDKVLIPSMTFAATGEVVRYIGAEIIPIDTEYGTNLITPEILEKAIEKHKDIKLLIVVHYGGQAAQIKELIEICNRHGIKIMEDAAHAFPTRKDGQLVGTFGDITCFSFYANKTITTGEGGMLVTNDESVYKRVKTMRLHGINRDIWDRFTSKTPSWEYDVIDAGYKYNMPDLAAAIGLGQLEKAELFRSERQKAVQFYYEKLKDLSMIDLPICHGELEDHAWHLFPIVLNQKASISRNEFIEKMSEQGVGTSVHYKPIHQLTYYKERYNLIKEDYPNAELTWSGNVSLPLYPYMTSEELQYIVDAVKNILA